MAIAPTTTKRKGEKIYKKCEIPVTASLKRSVLIDVVEEVVPALRFACGKSIDKVILRTNGAVRVETLADASKVEWFALE